MPPSRSGSGKRAFPRDPASGSKNYQFQFASLDTVRLDLGAGDLGVEEKLGRKRSELVGEMQTLALRIETIPTLP